MYYVYIYLNILRPGNYTYQNLCFDYEPFYVGKGKDKRYLYHLEKVKNKCKYKISYKFEIIEGIVNSGNEPIIIKYDNLSEDDALVLEKETIRKIGRFDLVKGPLSNRNDGGHKPQDNYHHDLESKKKISIASKNREAENRYTLISNDGIIYDNIKLNEMCIKFNLDYQKMRKSSNLGKIKPIRVTSVKLSKQSTLNCVGWEVINKKIIKEYKNKKLRYILISPDDKKYEVYTNDILSDLLNELNLDLRTLSIYRNRGIINIRNIRQCKKEESKNCQGWQFLDLKNDKNDKIFTSVRKINWRLTSPNGEVHLSNNLSSFCNDNNLSERTFRTFKNRLICMSIRKNYTIEIINSIGWMCEHI